MQPALRTLARSLYYNLPPNATSDEFARALPRVCEEITSYKQAHWEGNPAVCRELFFDERTPLEEVASYLPRLEADSRCGINVRHFLDNLPSECADAQTGRASWLDGAPPVLVIGAARDAVVDRVFAGFPAEALYADPENAAYDALLLQKGVVDTFFTPDTPFAILRRLQADGAADLVAATSRWKPWLPPKADQGLQQGGAFVFEGDRLLFQHRDPSTGAHADLNTLLRVALEA